MRSLPVLARHAVAIALLLLVSSARGQGKGAPVGNAPGCSPEGAYTPICGVHGPEDMELLPDGLHAVVSELPSNFRHSDSPGLMLVNLHSHRVEPLAVATSTERGWGDPSCTAPPHQFGSHGIHLSRRSDRRLELLVVNHDERESIEALELEPSQGSYRGVWRGCVPYKEGVFNDVAADGDHGFVAIVTMSMADRARTDMVEYMTSGRNTGWVVQWSEGEGMRRLPNTAVPMPGGIQLSPDRRTIFYTSWSAHDIRMYNRQRGTVVRTTPLDFFADNISVRGDGQFLVAGMNNVAAWKACFKSKPLLCPETSVVAVVDPQTLRAEDLLDLPSGHISGVSVAVQSGSALYMGSAVGDRLLELDLPHSQKR